MLLPVEIYMVILNSTSSLQKYILVIDFYPYKLSPNLEFLLSTKMGLAHLVYKALVLGRFDSNYSFRS